MPRKTDGIPFDLHPSPKKGEDGKPLLYARMAAGRKISFEQLEAFCVKHRHVEKGRLDGLFDIFLDAASFWFTEGYRVETPIGSFAPKLKLIGDHTDPNKVTGRDIMFDGVEFIPSKELIKAAGQNKYGYRRNPGIVGNSQMYDEEAMTEALRKSLSNGFTSVSKFMIFSGLKRDSAQKYLDSLTHGDPPRLRRSKSGRSYIYTPHPAYKTTVEK